MNAKIILFVFTFLYLTVASAQTKWKNIETDQYKISYPGDWSKTKNGYMNTELFIFSQADSDSDNFRENVNLIIQNLHGLNMTMDKFVEISEQQVKTMFTDAKIIVSERLKNNNIPYHRLVYQARQGKFQLKFVQYFFIFKQKAFILTFTSEKAQFDNYYPVAKKILNSFRIKR